MNDFEWLFYAVTNNNRLVLGFIDENDCRDYCRKYHFKQFTRNGLKNKKINPNNINNLIDDNVVPEWS